MNRISHKEEEIKLINLVKQHTTIIKLAKAMKLSRQQMSLILRNEDNISIKQLKDIMAVIGYKVEINIQCIE